MPDEWDFSTQRRTEQPQPIITYGLCALCVLFTLARWYPTVNPAFARIGAIVSPTAEQIWGGAYFGIFTTFFAHVDLVHLLFNMMWLVQLGRAMEPALPPWGYILFIVTAAGVSMGCELAISGNAGIGASGVVYAMFGMMWVGKARYRGWSEIANRQNLNVFLIWGVYCIFSTWAGFMRVANVAHFSGLLFGLSVGWLFLAPRRKSIWAAPLALTVLLSCLSLFWLPWSAAWSYYRADKAFEAKDYLVAIAWYHRSLRLGGERYITWENISRAWANIALNAKNRGDDRTDDEATAQSESAKRLEGPDPASAPEQSGPTGFHPISPNR